ncbi:MAG: hypothetical protein ACKOW3_03020 [Hyphomicrobium sp.]
MKDRNAGYRAINFCTTENSSAEADDAVLIVGYSIRCGVLASYLQQEAYWSYAWQKLAKLGKNCEKTDNLLSKLSLFVDNVLASSTRNLDILPNGCPGLCRDECLAVSIIVASQLGPCPALKACAFALLENYHMEPCLTAAVSFGAALKETGASLSTTVLDDCLKWTLQKNDQKFFHA